MRAALWTVASIFTASLSNLAARGFEARLD
jgi:hypothetical protein